MGSRLRDRADRDALRPGDHGRLQSTVGNLPEFFVVFFALQTGGSRVAETAILGSILVNALLVLGIVLIAARWAQGQHHALQPAAPTTPRRCARRVVPDRAGRARDFSHDPASHHTRDDLDHRRDRDPVRIRDLASAIPAADARRQRERDSRRICGPQPASCCWLAGVGSAFVSDWFVDALEPTIHKPNISQAFAGLVIVAIAGNAVENFSGIASRSRGDPTLRSRSSRTLWRRSRRSCFRCWCWYRC